MAVEVLDEDIEKVIVTDEDSERENVSMDELQELLELYIEMDAEDGYAAHYMTLPFPEAANFSFRGIDEEGITASIF